MNARPTNTAPTPDLNHRGCAARARDRLDRRPTTHGHPLTRPMIGRPTARRGEKTRVTIRRAVVIRARFATIRPARKCRTTGDDRPRGHENFRDPRRPETMIETRCNRRAVGVTTHPGIGSSFAIFIP